ncbi:MAG TPA: sialate O-acetylesterase [Steroidobacteraceae bacterium]|nr:sialate O-acetylesterase [Steroidobacteraceae bacterium]
MLQRDRSIPVWGNAAAGEEVTVTLAGATRSVRAAKNGRWSLQLPPQPAGGPHTLSARTGARTQDVHDVLIGDVWLCSGQSNMEFPVSRALDARAEIAASANDRIRHLKIAHAGSTTPRTDFEGTLEWKVASPATTGDFSATCFFFVRELRRTVDVPMGIILSAWGGSKIEPWMSEQAIRGVGGYENALEVAAEYRKDPALAAQHWGELWKQWWRAQPGNAGNEPWTAVRGDAARWRPAPAELTPWESWGVPALAKFDGMVWYRTSVKLSAAQAQQAAELTLGVIDEVDLTFVNGRAVGSSPCCGDRRYALAAGMLRAGDNLIVVNAFDTYASGGMYGPAEKRALTLADGTKIPLTGWQYQQSGAHPDIAPPRAPWEPTAGIAMLYNAMIAPLANYGLRGVAWYQGESNSSVIEGHRYEAQMRALMGDWRQQFGAPLPFLVVQLANYGATPRAPVESGAALTREAQRRAVAADGNAGLAVTIDIGNRDDVHPTNKQELGRRLARAARHVVYGEQISPSGAQPAAARRTAAGVLVTFADFDAPLVVYDSRDPAAFELCGPEAGSCRFVRAELRDSRVLLTEPAGTSSPTRVRFCWGDSPICNLYDSAGLPVGPFEIEIQ